jgi:hypothetical protein
MISTVDEYLLVLALRGVHSFSGADGLAGFPGAAGFPFL